MKNSKKHEVVIQDGAEEMELENDALMRGLTVGLTSAALVVALGAILLLAKNR